MNKTNPSLLKKVLVIGYVWPEPNSSAAGSHMMSLLRFFKKNDFMVEFATPCAISEHMIDLGAEGINSRAIELNSSSFDEYISEYNPDIVLFDRFMMEEQFGWRVDKNCPNALKILDTEDLQFLRNARHEALKQNRELTQKDLNSDLSKREIASILRCDISLIISTYEIELLTKIFKIDSKILYYLPFMIDLKTVPKNSLSFEEREHFMTIGNFRHAPNWDVVLYLQKIWPLIRKELPKAELHIYGSYPPPKATALNNPKTGFLIKGWANDAKEVIEKSKVCLAPIRFGAGIKGKLLDSMIMRTPSVTTSIGAEGMSEDKVWNGFISDDINDFVKNAVSLYSDKQVWEEASFKSLKLLEKYDKESLEKELLTHIQNINKNLSQHRLDNFLGEMLKHHTLSSTKYMSQWIEEKNKNKS
ncbi:glycosyl transferase [Malaciobacter pacificus]|jgi:glycosyltransferase involved in cell wall biosynthesis|uniref:Glycosyltransferase, family 1 n=1 Tax=Malaciobacter pacificus TaxID=1080223 RepID=A0A5C2HBX2_9BACT|nr:glycosyltransferase [Malaciobacter pacificus]QEP34706.1 glycosyltransferase, family 1 [Malaciobacter pacificus]GGD48967.1 glycosyl transferase [Malaciobacter pacificus]